MPYYIYTDYIFSDYILLYIPTIILYIYTDYIFSQRISADKNHSKIQQQKHYQKQELADRLAKTHSIC